MLKVRGSRMDELVMRDSDVICIAVMSDCIIWRLEIDLVTHQNDIVNVLLS